MVDTDEINEMSVLELAVAHKQVSVQSERLKELRLVLKCLEVWENGPIQTAQQGHTS